MGDETETRTHPSHWPTAQLRFVERVDGQGEQQRTLRILQQLWNPNYGDGTPEWRDVPLEAAG